MPILPNRFSQSKWTVRAGGVPLLILMKECACWDFGKKFEDNSAGKQSVV